VTASRPEPAEQSPVPLTRPHNGTPTVVGTTTALQTACDTLVAGTGPVAVDTERASGYRYWQRAYLLQLHRAGSGTILIDPIAFDGDLGRLTEILAGVEWVLHAADQDLPCLRELNLIPPRLFDTELAARLAGYDRVALGTMTELLLGYQLEKGHSAADWSRRPLPEEWLNYAALDVELLLPLRDQLETVLAAQEKLDWAHQEFAALRDAPPTPQRSEPWRRTSGIHKVRTARGLAAVRALWQARDTLAYEHDKAPGRILPDKAIIAAVLADPHTSSELHELSMFRGRGRRRYSSLWLRQLQSARRMPAAELPKLTTPTDGPPPANRWADRAPDAAARLAAAKEAVATVATQYTLPVENLLQPSLLRQLCWSPPADTTTTGTAAALRSAGARGWQIDLVAGPVSRALAPDG